MRKLCHIKEIKLREFNFKLIHGIMPCNLNLFRWKLKFSNRCDVCHDIQSQEHLLFNCIYVRPLWKLISNVYDTDIDYNKILGVNNCCINLIVTLISFLIYKEWLLLSLEFKSRQEHINFFFYKNELKLRLDVYRKCMRFSDEDLNQMELLIGVLDASV